MLLKAYKSLTQLVDCTYSLLNILSKIYLSPLTSQKIPTLLCCTVFISCFYSVSLAELSASLQPETDRNVSKIYNNNNIVRHCLTDILFTSPVDHTLIYNIQNFLIYMYSGSAPPL